MGGTSMATPVAAGLVTLIREHLRRTRGIRSPSAALVKAVLLNGAVRVPVAKAKAGTIADHHQGFGRASLAGALLVGAKGLRMDLQEEGKALATGEAAGFEIQVKAAGRPLKLTMAYTDFPGTRLINNLNLILTAPTGRTYTGNQGGATLVMDTANNVEKIVVPKAAAGTWKVQVVGSNVPEGRQDYALAWSGAV
jgi:hypothetical protein